MISFNKNKIRPVALVLFFTILASFVFINNVSAQYEGHAKISIHQSTSSSTTIKIDIPNIKLIPDNIFPIVVAYSDDNFKTKKFSVDINKSNLTQLDGDQYTVSVNISVGQEDINKTSVRLELKNGQVLSNTLGPCRVLSATIKPSGIQSTDWYKKARAATSKDDPNLVRINLKTQNCAGKRLNFDVWEFDPIGNDQIMAFGQTILIHESEEENFTLMPGETECESITQVVTEPYECRYFLKAEKSSNGVIEEYSSWEKTGGMLIYNCDSTCNDDWVFQGLENYFEGQQVQAQTDLQATGTYELLAPLPVFGTTFNIEGGLTPYLSTLFRLLIGIAGILAVIMIVVGGIEYMSTDAISGKEEGKERVTQAIIGLIIALGAWLLLNTINPDILSLRFSPEKQTLDISYSEVANAPQTAVGGKYCNGKYNAGDNWEQVAGSKAALPSGVTDNRGGADCQTVGQQACTSIRGLNPSKLQSIRNNCSDCELVITGGTECWLHSPNTQHQPGNSVIDLRATKSLNKYITGSETFPNDGKNYCKNGVKFLAERAGQFTATTGVHWHVQQSGC